MPIPLDETFLGGVSISFGTAQFKFRAPEAILHVRLAWPLALQKQRIARIADWRSADWSLRVGDFTTSDPLDH
eukprot:7812463-Alexandrium_andersonii.AAC.1